MSKTTFYNLFLTGLHGLIDLSSAYICFNYIKIFNVTGPDAVSAIVLYNFLAFGMQLPLGFISDKYKLAPKFIMNALGMALATILFINQLGFIAIITIGLSNALLHIGAGSIVLTTSKHKATYAGIFISAGALGLLLGKSQYQSSLLGFSLILIILLALVLNIFLSRIDWQKNIIEVRQQTSLTKYSYLLLSVLLTIVLFRSLIGFTMPFPWRSTFPYAEIIITLSIFAGKISGGILADKFGLLKVALLSVFASMVLIFFGTNLPLFGILGMLLFQMTTAITLILIFTNLPKYPGTSLGLTTLSLFIGYIPSVNGSINIIKNPIYFFAAGVITISLVVLTKYIFGKKELNLSSDTIKL